jgi:hypothetical protein
MTWDNLDLLSAVALLSVAAVMLIGPLSRRRADDLPREFRGLVGSKTAFPLHKANTAAEFVAFALGNVGGIDFCNTGGVSARYKCHPGAQSRDDTPRWQRARRARPGLRPAV